MGFDNSVGTSGYILLSIINRYKNYRIIFKIKLEKSSKFCSGTICLLISFLTSDKVRKLLKSLNLNKTADINKLQIKLVKLVSKILSKSLSTVMNNNSITLSTFPGREKVAISVPVE